MGVINDRFLWDGAKALANERKHGITFMFAAQALQDRLADFRYDRDHGSSEDRWVVMGMTNGILLVVVYAIDEEDDGSYVRLISARRATLRERREYESGEYSVREPAVTDEYNVRPMVEIEATKIDDDYDDGMKAEYDFSDGVRGVFRDCRLPLPIDNEVLGYFHTRSIKFGIDTTEAINEILRAHVGLPPRTAPPATLREIHENLRRHFGLPPRPVKPSGDSDVAKRR
jgi:uncharacterized DUF497 family protein